MRARLALPMLSLLVATTADAGQLHLELHGMREVLAGGRAVVTGKVVSRSGAARKARIEVEIDRVWRQGTEKPELGSSKEPQAGERATYDLYGGVEWTDPGKSPLDFRLRDALDESAVKVGMRVAVVPTEHGGSVVEVLPVDAAVLRRLALLCAPNPKAALGKETTASLRDALRDLDLAELVRGELELRGALDPSALIAADRTFFDKHYRALAPRAQRRFLDGAIPLARKDKGVRDRLCDVVLRQPAAATLTALAPLVALFDWKREDERQRLEDFRLELITAAEAPNAPLSAFGDFLYDTVLTRPAHRSNDDDFPKLTAHLDAKTKGHLAARLLERCGAQSVAGKDVDGFLLAEAVRLAAEAPTLELIPLLKRIDPDRPKVRSEKEMQMTSLLMLATLLGKRFPRSIPTISETIDDVLARYAPSSEAELAAYRAVVGLAPTKPARPAELELTLGQMRKLDDGTRVSFKQTESGLELSFDRNEGGQSRTFEANDEWYREWWIDPYLIIVTRAAPTRVKLRLTPYAKEPRALEPADAYEMAKAALAKRRCVEMGDQDPDDSNGRYRYQTKGPSGTCLVLIGLYSKKIVRITP